MLRQPVRVGRGRGVAAGPYGSRPGGLRSSPAVRVGDDRRMRRAPWPSGQGVDDV